MSDNQKSIFELEAIKDRELLEEHHRVLNVLDAGMPNLSPAVGAVETAFQLDESCPPLDEEEAANSYIYAVFELFTMIAGSPEMTTVNLDHLVSIIENLRLRAKGTLEVLGVERRVWFDLPYFDMCLGVSFNDPTLGIEGLEFTAKSAQSWRNINSFAARCLRAGVAGPYVDALRALEYALETDNSHEEQDVTECKICVACEWIFHTSRILLRWAQENIGYTDVPVEDSAAYYPGGPLYNGPSTMCLQRWGFWMERFQKLGKETPGLGEEARNAALEAVETMRKVEAALHNTMTV